MFAKLFGRGGGASDVTGFDDLRRLLDAGECVLIDVREPAEFGSGRVPGSQNMPLSRFNAAQLPREKKVVLICRSGGRSGNALRAAHQAGRDDVTHFAGGVGMWQSLGGPMVR